uniref:Ig-like domain-containing protein n=1 Tax=Myripristis murdjan TaxID=586833 RepID=A0A667Z6K5_9TELE
MANKKLSFFRTLFGFFFSLKSMRMSGCSVLLFAVFCVWEHILKSTFYLQSTTAAHLPFCGISCHPYRSNKVRAVVGENVTLPCQTEPPKDLQSLTVEWKYNESFVHHYRTGQDDHDEQHQQYRHRTILSHEDLVKGNLSLKLLHVQLSDQGNYTCRVVKLSKNATFTSGHVSLIGKHCKSIRGRSRLAGQENENIVYLLAFMACKTDKR